MVETIVGQPRLAGIDSPSQRNMPIFRWLRERRRKEILAQPFPDSWRAVLEQHVAHWPYLDVGERVLLQQLVQVFVVEKNWEGCGGLEMTDEIRVTIAGLACLLVLGLEHDLYRRVDSILVYPSTVVAPARHAAVSRQLVIEKAAVPISGEAMLGGPVLLVWDAVRRDAVHPERGHNVVFHEFAHKLDMLDGTIDGMPPLADRAQYERWVEVCTREYRELQRQAASKRATFLDHYAGTNVGEFFAVVTETFFEQPVAMRRRHSDLYAVLQGFYRQDPAARQARSA